MKKRRDGYDVLTEESEAARRAVAKETQHGQESAIYDALHKMGRGTRYDLAEATGMSILTVSRRVAGMRNAGIIRQLPAEHDQIGPTNKKCSTLCVVPKFLHALLDRRFRKDFDEFHALDEQYRAALATAWEIKDARMQKLKQIHRKLRKMRKAGEI